MLQHKITRILITALLLTFCGTSMSQITVMPHGICVSMDDNDAVDSELILINDYEEPITFSIDYHLISNEEERRQGPQRDEPGEIIRQFYSPLYNMGGMAFDGELLWGSSQTTNQLCAMTLEGEEVMVVDINDQPKTLAFDGELLWCSEWGGSNMFIYDLEGEQIDQFNMGMEFRSIMGMTSDQEEFIFMNTMNPYQIRVISIEDREEVAAFEYRDAVGGADIWSIEWVESHRDGQLWCNFTGHLYQLSVDEEWNVEAVSDFDWNTDSPYNDLAHDGEYMWHGMWDSNTWFQCDEGVSEYFMLTFNPEEGEIPGEENIPVELFITSEGIEPGNYNILIKVETDREIVELTAIVSVDSPAAFLTCRVTDAETEETMRDVRIDVDRYEITRFTNNNGISDFESLPTGEYNITFSSVDYLTHVEPFRIDGEGEVMIQVEMLHAECTTNRDNIESALEPDNIMQTEITVSNAGNGPLTYTTEKRLLGQAIEEPWERRRSLNVGEITGDSRIQGIAFFDDLFYFAGGNERNPVMYVLNREGEVINEYAQLGGGRNGYKDIAYDGELIWGSGERNAYGFTPDGEQVTSFDTGISSCSNIAWDNEREILWMSGITTDITGLDREGNLVAELNRQGIRIYGLSFWPDDPDGYQLYIFHKNNDIGDKIVTKMNVDNGDLLDVVILEPDAIGTAQGCFITNHYDIYSWVFMANVNNAANDRLEIWQVDARKDWMAIEPAEGEIEAGDDQDFIITLDATGPPPALFEGEIIFNHDGIGGQTPITVSLQVGEGGGGEQVDEMMLNFIDGWNMVSAYVQPDPDNIVEIMQELVEADQLILMKNGVGRFYNPAFNFNNIPGWLVSEGYMVKVDGVAEMVIAGESVNPDTPLPLIEGWQMISYYPREGIDAIAALSDIVNALIMAKDGSGRFYSPAFGFCNMGDMVPGQGYLLKMDQATELIYTVEEELARQSSPSMTPSILPVHPNTGENMSLLIQTGELDGEIGVYSKGHLVGSGIIQDGKCGIAVWGDDHTTSEIDGAIKGEELEVSLHNVSEMVPVKIETIFGEDKYSTDGFSVLRIQDVKASPGQFGIVDAYPNPFNNRSSIKYNLKESSEIDLALFDLTGRRVLDLVSGRKKIGQYSISIEGSSLSSGMYIVQLQAGEQISKRKVTLVK